MPYILNKTNGTIVATVQDASLDLSTDLIFVGRNYAGYGEWQNENFLKLLENFANTIPPTKPVEGEIWYDTANKKINVYNGGIWKQISNLAISAEVPASSNFTTGDLWYDSDKEQLYAFNGTDFTLIGPPSGADTRAQWRGDLEYSQEDIGTPKYNIKAVVGSNNDVVAVVSNETFTVDQATQEPYPSYPIYQSGSPFTVSKGITLLGADPESGNSESAGTFFWGTARHAANANTATSALSLGLETSPLTGHYPILFVNTSTSQTQAESVYTDPTNFYYDPATNTVNADYFDGIATSAYYADLAERYEADAEYDVGTVLVIGGIKEVTTTNVYGDTKVIGIVSKKPAYLMNSDAGSDNTHPAIALKGRVPCKVRGKINKGDLLVTSTFKGYAESAHNAHPNAVIGKALQSFDEGFGVIEVLVV